MEEDAKIAAQKSGRLSFYVVNAIADGCTNKEKIFSQTAVTFLLKKRLKEQMEKDESYIITRILAGKTEEYAYFLDTYGQPVFSLIVRMVNSEEDAEELTQDTFMKAFEHLSSFNGKSSFSTWIYRIAYNTALSFLRKKNVEQTVIDDNQWNRISDTQIDDALNNESEEQIEKLQQALTKLTAEERALVTLFYEEEHSIQELAQILNLNEGNIKVKLHRLRKKLYVLMQKED